MKKYAEGLRLTEDQLNERASKFAKEMFGWEIPVRVKIEPRFQRTYGRCWLVRKPYPQEGLMLRELKIAAKLVNGDYREEDINDIIKHELIHWYTDMTHQKNCGHGEEFKENCERLGVTAQSAMTRPTIYQKEEDVNKKRKKSKRLGKNEYHEVLCWKCRKVLYRSKNRTKLIDALRLGYNEGCKECRTRIIHTNKAHGSLYMTPRVDILTDKEVESLLKMGVESMQYKK